MAFAFLDSYLMYLLPDVMKSNVNFIPEINFLGINHILFSLILERQKHKKFQCLASVNFCQIKAAMTTTLVEISRYEQ